jgi:hypothetical protein
VGRVQWGRLRVLGKIDDDQGYLGRLRVLGKIDDPQVHGEQPALVDQKLVLLRPSLKRLSMLRYLASST